MLKFRNMNKENFPIHLLVRVFRIYCTILVYVRCTLVQHSLQYGNLNSKIEYCIYEYIVRSAGTGSTLNEYSTS